MSKKKLTVLDLFCGCGGLSLGFIKAGYNVILGVDHDEAALNTYRCNHSESEALNADLFTDEAIDEIECNVKRILGSENKIDLVIGGPPCQGFSLTGSRDINDSRNTLYLAMVKTVRRLQPKAL